MRILLVLAAACGSSSSTPPGAAQGSAIAECKGAACWTTPDGFRFVHPLPTGAVLRAVKAMPDGSVWIAGDGATLLRIAPDRTISRIDVPDVPTVASAFEELEAGAAKDFPGTDLMKVDFKGIAATGPNDVWIAMGEHDVSHWDGHAWKRTKLATSAGGDRFAMGEHGELWSVGRINVFGTQNPAILDSKGAKDGPQIGSDERLTAITRDGSDIWVGGMDGHLWRSHAGGKFEPMVAPGGKHEIRAMAGQLVLTDGGLFTRDGKLVTEIKGARKAMLALPEPVWVVGEYPTLVEHGVAREVPIDGFLPKLDYVLALDSERIEDVDGRAPNDVWMAGRAGQILHWDGTKLAELSPHLTEEDIVGVVPTGGDGWLAVAGDGMMITGTAAAGVTGHERGPLDKPRAVARTLAGEIVLAGCHGDLYVRGKTWTKLPKLDACITAIGGVDAAHLWAVGSNELVEGKAWRLLNGTWTEVQTGLGDNDSMRAVAAAPNGDVWLAGDGAVLVAKKGGALERVAKDEHDDYRAFAVRAPDDIWIATDAREIGSAGSLLHWDGKAMKRFDHLAANGLRAVAILPGGELWAVGADGVATHTRDGLTFKAAQTAADLDVLVATPSGALVGAGSFGSIVVR